MPGTNAGTGEPIAFVCAVARRGDWRSLHRYAGHRRVVRTGRERPYRRIGQGIRTDTTAREYRCECGHVGWSAHTDLKRLPVG